MSSTTDTVIVRVGGEGGAVTLYGRRSAGDAWEFRRSSSDSSWSMLDDEVDATPRPPVEPVWVSSWGEGITLLDKYRWAQLMPLAVHADFREDVLVEVTRRLLAEPSPRSDSQMERWFEVCSGRGRGPA
jgi:hypothetical protein